MRHRNSSLWRSTLATQDDGPQAAGPKRPRRRRRSRSGRGRSRPQSESDSSNEENGTLAAPSADASPAQAHTPNGESNSNGGSRPRGSGRRRRRRRRGGSSDPQRQQLLELLRREFGLHHFRPGQEQIMRSILDGKDTLAVLPTGGGKSLTYQLPSLLLDGLTVVVSPLIALIRDQFEKLRAQGIEAIRLDSSLTATQREETMVLLEEGEQKVLLITPEGATGPAFKKRLGDRPVALFVVDEAHCVSEWGHDFRPAYLGLGALIEELGQPTTLALTATAAPQVREEIVKRLGLEDPLMVVRSVARPNLRFEVCHCDSEDDKRRELIQFLRRLRRPGIVYCSTVKDVQELGALCKLARIPAEIYHGRLTKAERDHAHQRFMSSGKRIVMIATSAFGLGVDKSDIRYVIHYQMPGSLESYVQEAGRAGRDGLPARCILLWLQDDLSVQRHFLSEGPATRSQIRKLVDGLSAWSGEGRAVDPAVLAMSTEVGVTRTKAILEGLRDAGMVTETDGEFTLVGEMTVKEAVTLLSRGNEERKTNDRRRLEGMIDYASTDTECRVTIIRRYFEDGETVPCGRCDVCEPKLPRRRRRAKRGGRAGGSRDSGSSKR